VQAWFAACAAFVLSPVTNVVGVVECRASNNTAALLINTVWEPSAAGHVKVT
jgi:hypothetical protein